MSRSYYCFYYFQVFESQESVFIDVLGPFGGMGVISSAVPGVPSLHLLRFCLHL